MNCSTHWSGSECKAPPKASRRFHSFDWEHFPFLMGLKRALMTSGASKTTVTFSPLKRRSLKSLRKWAKVGGCIQACPPGENRHPSWSFCPTQLIWFQAGHSSKKSAETRAPPSGLRTEDVALLSQFLSQAFIICRGISELKVLLPLVV